MTDWEIYKFLGAWLVIIIIIIVIVIFIVIVIVIVMVIIIMYYCYYYYYCYHHYYYHYHYYYYYYHYYYHLYYNYEKYPLFPLKRMFLALIEQYLPTISDSVYSVHQSFMWFLWLNWRKSTFYPITAPNDSKYWPIVTSSIQEPAARNCDVTMADCFRVVVMDAFLAQWCWGQWTLLALISLLKLFFLFCDPRVSTRGIASYYYY